MFYGQPEPLNIGHSQKSLLAIASLIHFLNAMLSFVFNYPPYVSQRKTLCRSGSVLNCIVTRVLVFSLQIINYVRLCLSAICGLQILGDDVRDRILGGREKILIWIDNVKKATSPHFEEAHKLLFETKERMRSRGAAAADYPSTKLKIASKL